MSLGQEKKRNQKAKTRQKKKQYIQNAMSLFIIRLQAIRGPEKTITRPREVLLIAAAPRRKLLIVLNVIKKIPVCDL